MEDALQYVVARVAKESFYLFSIQNRAYSLAIQMIIQEKRTWFFYSFSTRLRTKSSLEGICGEEGSVGFEEGNKVLGLSRMNFKGMICKQYFSFPAIGLVSGLIYQFP